MRELRRVHDNRFGRAGVVVGIVQLQRDTERVFEDMLVEQALHSEKPAPAAEAAPPELPPMRATPPPMYAAPPPTTFPTPLPLTRERSVTAAIELIDPRDVPAEIAAQVARARGPVEEMTTAPAPSVVAMPTGAIPAFASLPPLPPPRRSGDTWIIAVALVVAAGVGFLVIGPMLGGRETSSRVVAASPAPIDAAPPVDAAPIDAAPERADASVDAGVAPTTREATVKRPVRATKRTAAKPKKKAPSRKVVRKPAKRL